MAQLTAKDYLRIEKDRLLDEAKGLTDKAESEGRSLATEEKEQIVRLLKSAQEKQDKLDELAENDHIKEQIERVIGPVNRPAEKVRVDGGGSWGEAFINSDGYKGLIHSGMKAGRWSTGPIEVAGEFGYKETPPAGTLTEVNSGVVQPTVLPGIRVSPLRRLTVADLIASGTTASNSVRYLQEVGFSETAGTLNAAAAVGETDLKPASRIRLEQVDEPVRKIATYAPVSDEMLEDVDQIRTYLDSRLRLFIAHEEEDQLLNGDGTAPNISGFLDRSIQTSTQDALNADPFVAVYEAITAIRNTNNEPDGIIVNPTDWAMFRTSQDSNGQYYGGGPITGAYGVNGIPGNTLWGLPVVVTGAIAAGTLLIGAFGTQAQVFRKGGITVEASNSHDDYFLRNMTAIRAEERLALAVYNLSAFYAITQVEGETIT